jgi:hypothetical protein
MLGDDITMQNVSFNTVLSWRMCHSVVFVACPLAVHLKVRGLVSQGKAIPLQAWTGPEGSRRLRLPDFKKIGI